MRLWGYCVQLYSLRSRRNWGIGDFTDLCNFVGMCRKSGADIIGLNPVNVLGHCFPEEASPYSSVSRLFLNPIYIDVESVPEFRPEDRYQAEAEIADLNAADTIDYGRVYPLKMKVLQTLYRRMKEDPERMKAFDKFCRRKGEDLDNLATFQALYEDKWQDHWGGWRAWEKEYRKPGTAAVKKYQNSRPTGWAFSSSCSLRPTVSCKGYGLRPRSGAENRHLPRPAGRRRPRQRGSVGRRRPLSARKRRRRAAGRVFSDRAKVEFGRV